MRTGVNGIPCVATFILGESMNVTNPAAVRGSMPGQDGDKAGVSYGPARAHAVDARPRAHEQIIESGREQRVASEPPLTFDTLYAEHASFVFRVLRGMGVSDSLADDAMQDVFLVVHRR